jgi:hypothetical protein
MIDFSDPAQTTHNGQTIPINTQQKYDAGAAVVERYHTFYELAVDADAAQQYEQRVRNGMTLEQILRATYDDFVERHQIPTPK